MEWIASAAFGMEGMTGRDLKHMGMKNVRVMDVGGASFEGNFEDYQRDRLKRLGPDAARPHRIHRKLTRD